MSNKLEQQLQVALTHTEGKELACMLQALCDNANAGGTATTLTISTKDLVVDSESITASLNGVVPVGGQFLSISRVPTSDVGVLGSFAPLQELHVVVDTANDVARPVQVLAGGSVVYATTLPAGSTTLAVSGIAQAIGTSEIEVFIGDGGSAVDSPFTNGRVHLSFGDTCTVVESIVGAADATATTKDLALRTLVHLSGDTNVPTGGLFLTLNQVPTSDVGIPYDTAMGALQSVHLVLDAPSAVARDITIYDPALTALWSATVPAGSENLLLTGLNTPLAASELLVQISDGGVASSAFIHASVQLGFGEDCTVIDGFVGVAPTVGGVVVDALREELVTNGVVTSWTLSSTPADADAVLLTLNGQVLTQGVHYTLTGAIISLMGSQPTPATSDLLYVYY